MLYCCEEHVELALDVIVYEEETFPILEKIENINSLSTPCEYCKKPAMYMVSNERSHT